jgi:glycosyltransferase involved in cell wall biosynthesis
MADTRFDTKLPRVLLCGHLPPPMSGIGTYYQLLLNSSLPARVNLQFIDTSLRRRSGSVTGKWSLSNLVSAISDCARFTKKIVEYRPELCHIATSVGLSFLKHSLCIVIARIWGSKVLLHPHCSFYFFYERQGKAWQCFIRRIIGLCDGVVILSSEWKKLEEVAPGCHLYYLPNAIDLLQYVDIGQERIESQWEKTCLHILYLGHIGEQKGSFDLLCAAKTILKKDPGVVFDIVGQEQVIGDIKRLTAEINNAGLDRYVHIQPGVMDKEKIDIFRSADIFVYPSYHEGMPMAVIEAMACGLPIVATKVGGLPDLVHPGSNGILIPAGEPDQLAEAIHQLITDPHLRKSMQKVSLQQAQENFDVEKLVLRLVSIYRALNLPYEINRARP